MHCQCFVYSREFDLASDGLGASATALSVRCPARQMTEVFAQPGRDANMTIGDGSQGEENKNGAF